MKDLGLASAGSETGPWQCALRAQEAGEYTTAAQYFAACVPDAIHERAEIEFRIGWCLELAARQSAAIEHYEHAATAAHAPPLAIEALFRLAWLALQANEFGRARPLLERAIALAAESAVANPTVAHARYWQALCLESDSQLIDAAARYAAIADEGDPDLWHEAAYRRLVCLSQVGDFDGALAEADRLAAANAGVREPRRLAALQEAAHAERAQIERARAAA